MGDELPADPQLPKSNWQPYLATRPFGGLEFQVSEVVERLEAGVNSQENSDEYRRYESRRISTLYLEPEETSLQEILKHLEKLVCKTDPSCESGEPPMLPTDVAGRAAIVAHSVGALLSRLERTHAARLGAHIATETTRWLNHMFRLPDYSAYYHQDQLEGLVRVVRMLLHHRYPRFLEDGALAFTNRLPCIYSSVASPLGVVQHLCRQLGLPLACVRPVPVHTSGRGMDIEALERLCEEDVANERTPLLVLSEAGAPPLGAGDALEDLATLCAAKKLYLHIRGHGLAYTALTNNQGTSREGALAALGGLVGGGARLPALPLWAALKAGGIKDLVQRLNVSFRCARAIYNVIAASPGLKLLSEKPGGDDVMALEIVEAVTRASACVAWQFVPEGHLDARPPPYFDKLNSWLGQVLQREADMLTIEVCETDMYGVVLRHCPLEGAGVDESRIEEFASILETQLLVLTATVALREQFTVKVLENPLLRLVHVPGWAGLGGVRFVPLGWDETSSEELDPLNRKLVDKLRTTDGAFSCGEGDDGLVCVRFGMVTAETDVEELLELVVSAGKDVEESSRALTSMTEVLKKGIEKAQADIERENAERMWQEGLLRRVPVVGRVVDWWSPASVSAPRGRRLHLAQGTLQTTDDVYK
ncbi:Pyridoxal-dependent decarboxylase domain-containing protein 1 [Eumeta japonica]|uniref:Pyridoxal-dependent decarboxylase domain-containing protein 1 n=1 Tax=Eumeta variegata TaxID=151549 RepID=A0A4C1WZN8_EUMVA|nr:Pyridoxal-dependent decarboxylase domain-containing protein 1 [Eumeta japonica]